MLAIYKRELRSYFQGVTGFLFIALLVAFTGLYFSFYVLGSGTPYLIPVLSAVVIVFLLAVPVLTMRSFAEERKSKSDQMLLTSPASVWDIVLGKYLAMVSVLVAAMAIISLFPLVILALDGDGSLAADYSIILSFLLLGCAYIAIGMFISSLTESQVISAVGTFFILLLLHMIDAIADLIPVEFLSKAVASLSLLAQFSQSVSQILDLSSIVYLLSVSFLFVFLTTQALEKRRWN